MIIYHRRQTIGVHVPRLASRTPNPAGWVRFPPPLLKERRKMKKSKSCICDEGRRNLLGFYESYPPGTLLFYTVDCPIHGRIVFRVNDEGNGVRKKTIEDALKEEFGKELQEADQGGLMKAYKKYLRGKKKK